MSFDRACLNRIVAHRLLQSETLLDSNAYVLSVAPVALENLENSLDVSLTTFEPHEPSHPTLCEH